MGGVGSNKNFSFSVTSPQITTITPSSATVGATVTITGSGFGLTQDINYVTVNGIRAATSSWSNAQIVATVPVGAKLVLSLSLLVVLADLPVTAMFS